MDYKELGLKAGVEIHRQLSGHKLFCNCPVILREDKPDLRVKRYLRPVLSEIGEKDVVAEYEQAKGRYAIYEAYDDSTCEVELDESPPLSLNEEALEVALQIALILNCKIVDEIQLMRKQVLDYSNTSSFQRTMLIARKGYFEVDGEKIGIQSVCLEEDAARKIKEDKKHIVYRLDRLGIPLIEIATEPDIKTPEQARRVAEYIGMIIKSTGKARSGIGTVRQDVNVSISKGARVEIKGVQDLRSIPDVIKKEVERQLNLIEKGKKIKEEVRKANLDNTTSYLRPMPGSARMYIETDVPSIKVSKKMLKKIKLPELISEKAINLEKKYNINEVLARELIKKKIDLEAYVNKFKDIDVDFIAHVLIEIPKDIKRRHGLDMGKIKKKDFLDILGYLNKKEISREAVMEILIEIAKGKKININKYKKINITSIEKEIKELIGKKQNLSVNALMGLVMKKYRGKIDGKEAMRILKKYKKD